MARRITAIHAESLLEATDAPKLRITAVHAEILLQEVIDPSVADDLNTPWQDAVVVDLRLRPDVSFALADTLSMSDSIAVGLGLVLTGESLDNWQDNLQTFYGILVVHLTVSVADDLSKTGKGASQNKDSWKDGLQLNLTPFGDLFISIDDLETNLDDELALGLGLALTDDLNNWQEDAKAASGILIEAFDSMFYFQDEVFVLGIGNIVGVGDNLNAWQDAVANYLDSIRAVQDSLNFWQDQALVSATTLPAAADQLVLADAIQVALGIALGVTDDLNNWNELFQNGQVSVSLSVAVTDTLTMSDALASLIGSSNVSYLRRYLNDVVR